jgi:hypothetical protein
MGSAPRHTDLSRKVTSTSTPEVSYWTELQKKSFIGRALDNTDLDKRRQFQKMGNAL